MSTGVGSTIPAEADSSCAQGAPEHRAGPRGPGRLPVWKAMCLWSSLQDQWYRVLDTRSSAGQRDRHSSERTVQNACACVHLSISPRVASKAWLQMARSGEIGNRWVNAQESQTVWVVPEQQQQPEYQGLVPILPL